MISATEAGGKGGWEGFWCPRVVKKLLLIFIWEKLGGRGGGDEKVDKICYDIIALLWHVLNF